MAFEQTWYEMTNWQGNLQSDGWYSAMLAYKDVAQTQGVDFSSRMWHFRPGTTTTNAVYPPDGRQATVVYNDNYIWPTRNYEYISSLAGWRQEYLDMGYRPAYVMPPGNASDYIYLHEPSESTAPLPPAPGGTLDSWWFGAFVWMDYWSGYDSAGIFGGDYFTDPAGEHRRGSLALAIENIPGTSSLKRVSLNVSLLDGAQQVTLHDDIIVTISSNYMSHLMVQMFFSVDVSLGKRWHCRWFWDGKFVQQVDVPVDDDVFRWFCHSQTGLMRASMLESYPPLLMGVGTSMAPWNGTKVFGDLSVSRGMSGYLDEVMVGNGHPFMDESEQPIIDAPWTVGQEVFSVRRFPDPAIEGVNSDLFVGSSPVIDTGIPVGASITEVYVYASAYEQAGPRIAASVRASDTPFDQDDASLPWSDWTLFRDFASDYEMDEWLTVDYHGGGYGRYVQVRYRITPSLHPNMTVPMIYTWGIRADRTELMQAESDLPCRIDVAASRPLPCRILVRQSAESDIPCRIKINYQGTPVSLPCRIMVRQSAVSNLPCRIYQSTYRYDLPCRILYEPTHFDLPCRIQVGDLIPGESDLPCRIKVLHESTLPCRIEVGASYLPCRILVRQSKSVNLPCRIDVPPELPGHVNPLQSSWPGGLNPDGQTVVSFTWGEASWATFPILAYYWRLDHSEFVSPSTGWSNRTTRALTVDLDQVAYGSGEWYMHVVARNTAGYFGPMSTTKVAWNNPPTAPAQELMTIQVAGGQTDMLNQTPLVSYRNAKVISWSPAHDPDAGEVLTYEMQIATRSDFQPDPDTLMPSIINPDSPLFDQTMGTLEEMIKPGIYFCRVRAFDGKQYSEWSPRLGSFRVNAPPGRPEGTVVIQA